MRTIFAAELEVVLLFYPLLASFQALLSFKACFLIHKVENRTLQHFHNAIAQHLSHLLVDVVYPSPLVQCPDAFVSRIDQTTITLLTGLEPPLAYLKPS